MKKILFICLLLLTACADTNPDGSIIVHKGSTSIMSQPYEVVMDSCEYVRYDRGITHKGNCKFCAKREEERIRKIIIEELK